MSISTILPPRTVIPPTENGCPSRIETSPAAPKPPRRVPRWLARLVAGENAVVMGTESRGASNAKAKRELGWTLRYPRWRQGFVAAYASTVPAHVRGSNPAPTDEPVRGLKP